MKSKLGNIPLPPPKNNLGRSNFTSKSNFGMPGSNTILMIVVILSLLILFYYMAKKYKWFKKG
jgi:uncharacterized membrane protein